MVHALPGTSVKSVRYHSVSWMYIVHSGTYAFQVCNFFMNANIKKMMWPILAEKCTVAAAAPRKSFSTNTAHIMHLGTEFVGCICLQYTFVSVESTQTMRIIYPQGYWYIFCECALCCIFFLNYVFICLGASMFAFCHLCRLTHNWLIYFIKRTDGNLPKLGLLFLN